MLRLEVDKLKITPNHRTKDTMLKVKSELYAEESKVWP